MKMYRPLSGMLTFEAYEWLRLSGFDIEWDRVVFKTRYGVAMPEPTSVIFNNDDEYMIFVLKFGL